MRGKQRRVPRGSLLTCGLELGVSAKSGTCLPKTREPCASDLCTHRSTGLLQQSLPGLQSAYTLGHARRQHSERRLRPWICLRHLARRGRSPPCGRPCTSPSSLRKSSSFSAPDLLTSAPSVLLAQTVMHTHGSHKLCLGAQAS